MSENDRVHVQYLGYNRLAGYPTQDSLNLRITRDDCPDSHIVISVRVDHMASYGGGPGELLGMALNQAELKLIEEYEKTYGIRNRKPKIQKESKSALGDGRSRES